MGKRKGDRKDIWLDKFTAGYKLVENQPIFSPLLRYIRVTPKHFAEGASGGAARAFSYGEIQVNRNTALDAGGWAYVLSHCLLHFGLWHFQEKRDMVRWNIACDMSVMKFLGDSKLYIPPEEMDGELFFTAASEEEYYEKLGQMGLPGGENSENCHGFSVGGGLTDMVFEKRYSDEYHKGISSKFQKLFEQGLINAVSAAISVAAGHIDNISEAHEGRNITQAEKARQWFISSYPLLGALAADFKLVEDPDVCRRESISVAAISEALKTVYISPGAGLTEEECRFVIAHELMHAGLRHGSRCQGRDPYLWNVACDYVINGWLIEMGVGTMPRFDFLYDPEFSQMSAESIYDIIVRDIRRFRKLSTLRGKGLSDIIGEEGATFYRAPVDLDTFYKRALYEGMEYHKASRGLLPAGLEEEIEALYREPISWDVKLACWFDRFFAPLEKKRTYSRLSRRQSSTPDIVRPRAVPDTDALEGRTFGVVIDTSGSMDQYLLASALGTVASYAQSRDVPYVRVVFCDAVAYDAGYMAPEAIMGRVTVRGRGGTLLQPGINFLEKAGDFPEEGPILIITDGYCDHFKCKREHGILIPKGVSLPFRAGGQIFEME